MYWMEPPWPRVDDMTKRAFKLSLQMFSHQAKEVGGSFYEPMRKKMSDPLTDQCLLIFKGEATKQRTES